MTMASLQVVLLEEEARANRAQSARAQRLAREIRDNHAIAALLAYAEEAERRAAELERRSGDPAET
jgi:predicted  nucleic acid-binding Zn-ribbon protein